MKDLTTKYIEDSNGNIIEMGNYAIGKTTPQPIATGTSGIYRRYLKDNISDKFYPITFRSAILGGIGRGSSKEIIDFISYINGNFEGTFKLITMANHVKYFLLDIKRKYGVLVAGDNILVNKIPVMYMPQKDLVFRSTISPDDSSRCTMYLSATDGKLHCHIKPLYEVVMDPEFSLDPILIATSINGMAAYIE